MEPPDRHEVLVRHQAPGNVASLSNARWRRLLWAICGFHVGESVWLESKSGRVCRSSKQLEEEQSI